MVIQNMGVIHPRLGFVDAEIFTKFWFLVHNVGSRYARKSIKGSKDSDDSLVSKKTLSQKLAHWIGAQGRVKLAKNTQKHPHLWRPPQRTPNTKRNTFFFKVSKKTCRIRRWFEQLSSSIGWEVMTEQSQSHYCGFAVHKGF